MPTPERIEISYTHPRGQVGKKPRPIPVNGTFHFFTNDPGELTIEFTGASPLADGAKIVPANKDLVAAKPGKYFFKCHQKIGTHTEVLGDPADPATGAGGELEVGAPIGTST